MWLVRNHESLHNQMKAESDGLIAFMVPQWLYPEMAQLVYTRSIARAYDRWAGRSAEVSVRDWQNAALRKYPRNNGDT
jgi:hypothetical protein